MTENSGVLTDSQEPTPAHAGAHARTRMHAYVHRDLGMHAMLDDMARAGWTRKG